MILPSILCLLTPLTASHIGYGLSSGVCTACPAGYISLEGNSSPCSACPIGTSSASGWGQCSPCQNGYYAASTGLSACTLCAAGSFICNPVSGIIVSCLPTYVLSNGVCQTTV